MDEKLKRIIYITLGAFVLLFLFLFIISACSNKKYSPEALESKITDSAINYYKYHQDELPDENSIMTLSINDLVSKEIIDDLEKLTGKEMNCSGYLTIENNNNYYMYSPQLSCESLNETYVSNNLKEILVNNVVDNGNGIYYINEEYYFRGDNVNNYLIFDNLEWRITKINKDNSIRLIEAGRREPVVWDDRYNSDAGATSGINNYVFNNINSRIKDELDNIYKNDNDNNYILSTKAKGYIKETALCIGKRNIDETINDGSIECSETLPGQHIGLLQMNEYIIASLDENCVSANSTSCSNYNYLADLSNSYWTLTGNSDNNSQVYKIYNNVLSSVASSTAMSRMVINISENTNVSGTGSKDDPFVVSGMTNEIRKTN